MKINGEMGSKLTLDVAMDHVRITQNASGCWKMNRMTQNASGQSREKSNYS